MLAYNNNKQLDVNISTNNRNRIMFFLKGKINKTFRKNSFGFFYTTTIKKHTSNNDLYHTDFLKQYVN